MRTIWSFLFVVCHFAADVHAQSRQGAMQVDAWKEKANHYCPIDLDSALYYLDRIIAVAEKNADCDPLLWALLQKASCYDFHYHIDAMAVQLEQVEAMIAGFDAANVSYDRRSAYLELKSRWGEYYLRIGLFDKALYHFKAVEDEIVSRRPLGASDLERLKFNALYLANTCFRKGDQESAIENYRQSAYYEQQLAALRGVPADINYIYKYLGQCYQAKGALDSAEVYYVRYLRFQEGKMSNPLRRKQLKTTYITSSLDLASLYRQSSRPDDAERVLRRALSLHPARDPFIAHSYFQMGLTMAEKQSYPAAQHYLERAIHAFRENYSGRKNHQSAQCLIALGDLSGRQSDWGRALDHYQKALIELSDPFNDLAPTANPALTQLRSPKDLLIALEKKSNALFRYAEEVSGRAEHLEAAWATALLAVDLIDSIRVEYGSDEDKRFLLEKSYSVYALAIGIAGRKGAVFHQQAFDLAEKSKAVLLNDAIQAAEKENEMGLPASTVEQLRQLRFALNHCRLQLAEASDPDQIQRLNNEQHQIRRQYEALAANLAPVGKRRPAQEAGAGLDPGQVMVAYFVHDTVAFLFISRDAGDPVQMIGVPWNAAWANMARTIGNDIFEGNDPAYFRKARALYEHLVRPVLERTRANRLLIIPDGELWNVPFAALLTQDVPESEARNFKNLPYLMREITIGYGFSLTLQKNMCRPLPVSSGREILGFAPSYRVVGVKNQPLDRVAVLRNSLYPLYHNKAETAEIIRTAGGRLLPDDKANKAAFMELLPTARVLHIAAHAKANHRNPHFSFIAFDNTGDTLAYPFRLYAHELYYRTRPLEMVVFSACETGTGPIWKGEGVISLARPFAFGGARSIVTTLWSIDDRASRDIMVDFYKKLERGLSKDAALQQATLFYIEAAPDQSRAHPRYWAAFTAIGNMEPVELGGWPWAGLLAGCLIVGVLLVGVWYFRRRW